MPHYRDLTPADEQALLDRHLNRVTDTCIPEEEAMRRIERIVIDEWHGAEARGERLFPHEFLYRVLRRRELLDHLRDRPQATAGCCAAMERNLPIFVPGWEDSTLGNVFAAHCMSGELRSPHTVRSGIEYMMALAEWYTRTQRERVDRLLPDRRRHRRRFSDLRRADAAPGPAAADVPLWGYFCQISDSTTSYGSYSGATPNEKITWGKLGDRHAEVRDRVGRDDRGAAGVCVRVGVVGCPWAVGRGRLAAGGWQLGEPGFERADSASRDSSARGPLGLALDRSRML